MCIYTVIILLLQRLYQYVFAYADIKEGFTVSKMIPGEAIPCSDMVTLESVKLNKPTTLAVVLCEGDVLQLLEETEERESEEHESEE